ncbi:MAG TPA: VOC family protein [Acidimicrobiales bacterium]|nr:VOC family protein [Acidimicrobiales bacterium]
MKLRQLVLVATDLEAVVGQLTSALGIEVAYRDPGVAAFGLVNAVMPVGDQFLEVVSPARPDSAAGRYLERRRGDGGYMAIVQVPDLDAARNRVTDLGIRIVWEGAVPGIRGMHLHPADVGGAILSLDEADPPDDWPWAGADWKAHVGTQVVGGFTAAEIQSDDPYGMARRWGQVLAVDPVDGPDGSAVLGLDAGLLRFVRPRDERGPGLTGICLQATDRSRAGEDMVIGGVGFRLV